MDKVKPHPTHEILDSSKVQDFLSCPRHFFYRYVLGWTPESTSIHLIFGEAWHRAMETILKMGYTDEGVDKAYFNFLTYYRKYFSEIEDNNNFPKSPASVIPALVEYIDTWRKEDQGNTVLYTEIAGTVPINDNRAICFRMDSIIQNEKRGVFSLEHKTGSAVTKGWYDQWQNKIQSGTYMHVMASLYEKTWGVMINGSIFRKKGNAFIRHPLRINSDIMSLWLWEVNHIVDMIRWNMDELDKVDPEQQVMTAFPRNGEYCTKWGRTCPFHDFCGAWSNPLKHYNSEEPPLGLKTEWWDPSDRSEITKENIIEID